MGVCLITERASSRGQSRGPLQFFELAPLSYTLVAEAPRNHCTLRRNKAIMDRRGIY